MVYVRRKSLLLISSQIGIRAYAGVRNRGNTPTLVHCGTQIIFGVAQLVLGRLELHSARRSAGNMTCSASNQEENSILSVTSRSQNSLPSPSHQDVPTYCYDSDTTCI